MMRRLFTLFIILVFTLMLPLSDAQAKRFGGGRSFGMQRSFSSFSRATPNPMPMQTPFQRPSASRWLGPLAGLVAGGILGSLLMSKGIGSGILSWLMVGGILLLIISFFRNRNQAPAPAYYQSFHENQASHDRDSTPFFSSRQDYMQSSSSMNAPIGFDQENFLREAKVSFIRLQAAYDQKNLNDLRQFTTPEISAEIQLQFQERGNAVNQTEVVSLEAELLDASSEAQTLLASVRFSGMIREEANQPAAPFNEIWHFQKNMNTQQWLVAGIQQN